MGVERWSGPRYEHRRPLEIGQAARRSLWTYYQRMNWGDIWAGVQAIAAVAALVGGLASWLFAKASRAAKRDAQEARDDAKRHLIAVEAAADAQRDQAEHLRGISNALERSVTPPALSISHVRGSLYRLTNSSGRDLTVENIDNREQFFRVDLEPGTELPAGMAKDFLIVGANGFPVPGQMLIGLVSEDQPVIVPIPPKP